ncbi:hypothetical protein Tco_1563311 [Tanacetum coccineum]
MYQKQKRLKKNVDYEQLIDVLAMDKLMLEEKLSAIKSKLELYDRLFFIMLGSFLVICVGFAFGKLLEDINVTWTRFGKKRTRLQLYTKVDEENVYSV